MQNHCVTLHLLYNFLLSVFSYLFIINIYIYIYNYQILLFYILYYKYNINYIIYLLWSNIILLSYIYMTSSKFHRGKQCNSAFTGPDPLIKCQVFRVGGEADSIYILHNTSSNLQKLNWSNSTKMDFPYCATVLGNAALAQMTSIMSDYQYYWRCRVWLRCRKTFLGI